jgi:hypothetical protein
MAPHRRRATTTTSLAVDPLADDNLSVESPEAPTLDVVVLPDLTHLLNKEIERRF